MKNPLLHDDEVPTIDTLGRVSIDVDRLIVSRALMQAASGAGKSWGVRRIVEQTYGRAQQFIFDPDGEFHTLRESLDFVLVGPGGDIPATVTAADYDLRANGKVVKIDPMTTYAAKLAQKLLQLGVNAIIDLSELGHRRDIFVRRFIEGMMLAPRDLWHAVMAIVDELQKLAPERGIADAESTEAIKDLATRGRKRGYALIGATQRIAEINKTVLAEFGNKLIGRTTLDNDIDRAKRVLGFSAKAADQILPHLKDGRFYVTGSAFSLKGKPLGVPIEIMIGAVNTTHPKAGSGALPPTPTPKELRSVLAELAQVPVEVEAAVNETQRLRDRVKELEGKLAITDGLGFNNLQVGNAKLEQKIRELEARLAPAEEGWSNAARVADKMQNDYGVMFRATKASEDRNENLVKEIDAAISQLDAVSTRLTAARNANLDSLMADAEAGVDEVLAEDDARDSTFKALEPEPITRDMAEAMTKSSDAVMRGFGAAALETFANKVIVPQSATEKAAGESLKPMERAFMTVLAQFGGMPRSRVLLFAGYRSSGDTSKCFARLISQGWAEKTADGIGLTAVGTAVLGTHPVKPTAEQLRNRIANDLAPMHRAFFMELIDLYPQTLKRTKLLERAGYKSSGDTSKAFGYLVAQGIAIKTNGALTLNPVLVYK
jgi:hypothetical protein